MRAQILTAWIARDESDIMSVNHPQLMDDYADIHPLMDVTQQPDTNLVPSPNLYIIEITCDQATLDLIDADPNYVIGWVE